MTRRIVNFTDIETTGMNEPEQRIVEVCSSLYDLDTEEHLKTMTWQINPMRKIEAKAQKAHGYTLDMLAGAPTWDIVAPAIRGTIEPVYMTVAHNGLWFDFPFLEREFGRVGHHFKWPIKFDTMTQGRWATATGKNPSLGELALCCDVEYDPAAAHKADYDVSVMSQCFFVGRKLGFYPHP